MTTTVSMVPAARFTSSTSTLTLERPRLESTRVSACPLGVWPAMAGPASVVRDRDLSPSCPSLPSFADAAGTARLMADRTSIDKVAQAARRFMLVNVVLVIVFILFLFSLSASSSEAVHMERHGHPAGRNRKFRDPRI